MVTVRGIAKPTDIKAKFLKYGDVIVYEFVPPLEWWHTRHSHVGEDVLLGTTQYAAVSVLSNGESAIFPCSPQGDHIDMGYADLCTVLSAHERALVQIGYFSVENDGRKE